MIPFSARWFAAVLAASGLVLAAVAAEPAPPFPRVEFLLKPEVIVRHTPERVFVGPSLFRLENGDILMAAPWGRKPADFARERTALEMPMIYRSRDRGRTWREDHCFAMDWKLTGVPRDGGISFLRLRDGRLAALFNRDVDFGGGVPVITFSGDEGLTWSPAKPLIDREDVYYVMNDRLIQLRSGRLVVPASHKLGRKEGDHDECLAFLSDDAGATWRLSRGAITLNPFSGGVNRGLAEPCVVELKDGRILMLARTGAGSHHQSISSDGGETWSPPQPTTLTAALSPLTLYRLPDGRLIVFYEHAKPVFPGSMFPRNPLVCATSADEGASWSPPLLIDDEGLPAVNGITQQHIYPCACFLPEGILLVYSSHRAFADGGSRNWKTKLADIWQIGGGERCLFKYPAPSR